MATAVADQLRAQYANVIEQAAPGIAGVEQIVRGICRPSTATVPTTAAPPRHSSMRSGAARMRPSRRTPTACSPSSTGSPLAWRPPIRARCTRRPAASTRSWSATLQLSRAWLTGDSPTNSSTRASATPSLCSAYRSPADASPHHPAASTSRSTPRPGRASAASAGPSCPPPRPAPPPQVMRRPAHTPCVCPTPFGMNGFFAGLVAEALRFVLRRPAHRPGGPAGGRRGGVRSAGRIRWTAGGSRRSSRPRRSR